MRRFALAATLSIAALSLAGCKSQQAGSKENADSSQRSARAQLNGSATPPSMSKASGAWEWTRRAKPCDQRKRESAGASADASRLQRSEMQ